jgi:hypothetical protein
MTDAIDRTFFFDHVRSALFSGVLTQGQVDGMELILAVWERDHGAADGRWLAYALATAFHETAFTMQPVEERGGSAYFMRRYDKSGRRPDFAMRVLGNTQAGDGVLFHGRGFVQLTGRRNYRLMGETFGVDLTSGPAAAARALESGLAARIMFKGMIEGLFTGRKLADYFLGRTADWRNARRIVNGLDQADRIGTYGRKFHGAIRRAAESRSADAARLA